MLGGDVARDGAGLGQGEVVVLLQSPKSYQRRVEEESHRVEDQGMGREKDEGETHQVRNLSKRLLREELRSFMLALAEIDGFELEGDLLLMENNRDALGAGRDGGGDECVDHGCSWWFGLCWVRERER